MEDCIPTITINTIAPQDVLKGQILTYDLKLATPRHAIMGISAHDALEGEPLGIHVMGVFSLRAGSDISVGNMVGADEHGHIIPTGVEPFGRAITSARKGENVTFVMT